MVFSILTTSGRADVRISFEPMDAALKSIGNWIRAAGPYLLIELVMPGGTLLAILLLAFRSSASRLSSKPATTFVTHDVMERPLFSVLNDKAS